MEFLRRLFKPKDPTWEDIPPPPEPVTTMDSWNSKLNAEAADELSKTRDELGRMESMREIIKNPEKFFRFSALLEVQRLIEKREWKDVAQLTFHPGAKSSDVETFFYYRIIKCFGYRDYAGLGPIDKELMLTKLNLAIGEKAAKIALIEQQLGIVNV